MLYIDTDWLVSKLTFISTLEDEAAIFYIGTDWINANSFISILEDEELCFISTLTGSSQRSFIYLSNR